MRQEYLSFGTWDDHHDNPIWIVRKRLGLSVADRRKHLHIIGQSGMGKSTLLEHCMNADIRALRGFGLLDPHGDLAEKMVERIPSWRTREVIYFDPANLERPISLNILAGVPLELRSLVADDVVAIFESIWGMSSWGPRLPWVLRCCVRTLLDHGGSSLLGVSRLLTDDGYRLRMLHHIQDPVIRAYWTGEFAGYDDRRRAEVIGPILNKIGPFLDTPALRNVLGQEGRAIDFRRLMDERRIFLANLSKGRLGEEKSKLTGSLLVTAFKLAAMRRAVIPEDERVDFSLYIDEFQNFTTSSYEDTLAEARKYHLALVMAHQYLDQLPDAVRAAVFGTVRSQMAFCVGPLDAEPLRQAFGEAISTEDLVSLGRGEVVARLESGAHAQVVRGIIDPPNERYWGLGDHIRKSSRFGQRRDKVERQVARMLGVPACPLGQPKRVRPYPGERGT